jgi:hypothetical protein
VLTQLRAINGAIAARWLNAFEAGAHGSDHNSVGGGSRDSLTRDRPQVVDPE